MSFASGLFLCAFLPLVLAGYWALPLARRPALARAWLLLVSLAFYAWSGWDDVAMLLASLALNYATARRLLARGDDERAAQRLLAAGIVANVALLLGYKLRAAAAGASMFLPGESIAIPLGLSFITFQQIAFLLDCRHGRITGFRWPDYLLFITFFPQLVMGPIVHFRELVPQFQARLPQRSREHLLVGLAIFAFGLFKKLAVADPLAGPVDAIYAAAARGDALSAIDAWGAAIGFQLQLFMDFSGYADMAIGLARMFGVDLPINYDDPFHARNRFDLWRRWHLTFVEFMRRHVFQPLARMRGVPLWLALGLTGMASGLWHGIGWTFVAWGLVQTALLMASHAWSKFRRGPAGARLPRSTLLSIATTFFVTAAVGVLFRADSLPAAGEILRAMLSPERLQLPLALQAWWPSAAPAGPWSSPLLQTADLPLFGLAALLVWALPQTRDLFAAHWSALDPRPRNQRPRDRRPALPLRFGLTLGWGFATGLLLLLALACLGEAQRFVYFQF